MIKRPERIQIIGKRFDIKWLTGDDPILPLDQVGECDTAEQEISIRNNLKPDTEKDTMLHETIHAVSDAMGLDMTEEQVMGLASGLLAVLLDNPTFARYLIKKEKV